MRDFMSTMYKNLVKPVLFSIDAERVHDGFTVVGRGLGEMPLMRSLTGKLFSYSSPLLVQQIGNRYFANPIGLSAGFDYEGKMTSIMPAVGFGFESMGTVTRSYYEGNKKPRLGRLPESKSLLVNKGFKSSGIEMVLNEYVRFVDSGFNLGISIGATNSPETSEAPSQIEDIFSSLDYLVKHATFSSFSYVEINISCPNVMGSGSLATPDYLQTLLKGVVERVGTKPVWVKFPIEITWKDAKALLEVMIEHNVEAVVIGNLKKKRDKKYFDVQELDDHSDKKGNFSGKPTWEQSNALIEKTYKQYGKKITIVGVGGVFSAKDAYHKIRLGASLVQLITGMIYGGPQVIGQINEDLVELLKEDGFGHISEAVGVGVS